MALLAVLWPVDGAMTLPRATRAAAAAASASTSLASGVGKVTARKTPKRRGAPARPLRPLVNALQAAARELHDARAGGAFQAPPLTVPSTMPAPPAADACPPPDPDRLAPLTVTAPGAGSPLPADDTPVAPAASSIPSDAVSPPTPEPASVVAELPYPEAQAPAAALGGDASAATGLVAGAAVERDAAAAAGRGAAGASGATAAPTAPRREVAVPAGQPSPSFWVDMAKSVVELLRNSRGVAGSLASARTEVNTAVDRYEAILRELKVNTTIVKKLQEENKALTKVVNDLKVVMEGSTPQARAQAESDLVRCRSTYASKLIDMFVKAETTGDVWVGQARALGVVHSVVADTLGLTLKDAEEMVSGKREMARSAKDTKKGKHAAPKTTPTVKVFSNRRAAFHLNLGEVVVKIWKETVKFPTDLASALDAAVSRLNRDKYLMSKDGMSGIVAGVRAKFVSLGREDDMIVNAAEVGDSGYVRALLGHCAFASTKVSLLVREGCPSPGGSGERW